MHTTLVLLLCTFAVGTFGHTVLQLDPDFRVMFHMTSVPNRIEIQVTAKTTGWVGFGFSKTHSYTNADMVIGYVDDSNNELISHYDYWSTGTTSFPTLDAQQDWFRNDTQCTQNSTHTILYYYRQLDTGDVTQDLVIPDDDVYLLWSYGASDTLETPVRQEIYHEHVNLVSSGSHGSSAAAIRGSIAIILLCIGLYGLLVKV